MIESEKDMIGYIYILVNPVYWNMVKIGYTSDIKRRLKELNSSTSVPIEYECYALYEVATENVDKKLHKIIDMLNPLLRVRANLQSNKREREFYSMSKEDAFLLLQNIAAISNTENKLHLTERDGTIQRKSQEWNPFENTTFPEQPKRERLKRFSFSEVEIEQGSVLEFVKDPDIHVTVLDDQYVSYLGEKFSLSALAQKLINSKYPLQGPLYFSYQGKVLADMRKGSASTGKKITKTAISEEEHFQNKSDFAVRLYKKLEKDIFYQLDGASIKFLRSYIAWRKNNRNFCEIHLKQDHLEIYALPPTKYLDFGEQLPYDWIFSYKFCVYSEKDFKKAFILLSDAYSQR